MAGVSGPVRRPTPESGLHPFDYSGTDSRHDRETGYGPWTSVDRNSGPVPADDWSSNSRFPDGPGAWRQT